MCDSIFKRQMPPGLLGDDGPYNYPDGSPVPVGMAAMLAASEGISHAEARRRMVEGLPTVNKNFHHSSAKLSKFTHT